MICVRLDGGIGNQMFQYAAGRALSMRLHTDLVMDLSTLTRNNSRVTARSFELGHFLHTGKLLDQPVSWCPSWLHRMPAVSLWFSPWRAFIERGVGWQSGFETLGDQTCLIGYWQSPRYFTQISHVLAQEFESAEPLSLISQAVLGQIASGVSVALHVRRGDYVSLASAAKFHGVLPLSYYAMALKRVSALLIDPQVFVFSDDPQWCRENLLLGGGRATYVTHNTGADAWQDLVLMGRCKHHVIANSSFSWWAAWLADQRWGIPGHVVVAPNRWFAGSANQYLQDRYPSHWQVLG